MTKTCLFLLFVFCAIQSTIAEVQFISNVNDYSLNCSIQSSAGNMVGLISTPLSTDNGFKIARIDTSTDPATIFLLNDAVYDNIFIGTFAVDPVLKKVMVMTEIDSSKRLLVYSTINGTLLNDVSVNYTVSAFAIDLHDSTVYALSLINDSLWIGSINLNDGNFAQLVDTLASNLLTVSQLIDFVSRDYIFISSGGAVLNIHRINLVSFAVSIIELPISLLRLQSVALYNNSLYAFLPEVIGNDTKWKFGTINLNTLETNYLESADYVNEFLRVPMAFDFTTMKLFTPVNDTSKVITFNLTNGLQMNSSALPDGYSVKDCTFEQECICCLQNAPASKAFKLEKNKNRLFIAKVCNEVPADSSAASDVHTVPTHTQYIILAILITISLLSF